MKRALFIGTLVRFEFRTLTFIHVTHPSRLSTEGGNLLLTKDGVVKLADFGACTYTALNKNLTVVGTPFWMAPEIIEMSDGAGTAADIWSLGCTVLELLTGSPPYFHLGTMQALFKMVEDPHPPIPEGYSGDLRDFLLKCFEKDFKKRPTAAQLLNHRWILANAVNTSIKKEDLEGKLKSVNQNKQQSGSVASDPATNRAKLKLRQVKHELKQMRAEQQVLQREIVSAKREKAELQMAINRLKR